MNTMNDILHIINLKHDLNTLARVDRDSYVQRMYLTKTYVVDRKRWPSLDIALLLLVSHWEDPQKRVKLANVVAIAVLAKSARNAVKLGSVPEIVEN